MMEKEGLVGSLMVGEVVTRLYTKQGINPLDTIAYEKRDSRIINSKGEVKFEMKDVGVPPSWSQLATDILAEKYIMKRGVPNTGREIGAREVVHRISDTIRQYGEQLKYFTSKEEAETFQAELSYMLINQIGAFNSPVWFNVGHYQQYGIKGGGKQNYFWNPKTDTIEKVSNTYEHPQCSACFIQSVEDNLESMMTLQNAEVRLFKGGSGTGTNFSMVRGAGERLSAGGKSSGLISFLKGYDAWAGVIKSGGTTRRAAKMVILDIDHPDIEDFIEWKVKEEKIVAALAKAGYSAAHFEDEAQQHAWGQNANNSVRVTDEFMHAVENDGMWVTRERTTGNVKKEYRARDIWDKICKAAWESGDPGLQFDTTVNKWHTCKESGRINASNPCSEYMFLDDSACNLASLNLMKFFTENGSFDVEKYKHACEVFTLAQEIIVDMSSYPTEQIAKNSHDFRPLGLGYANLGALLMVNGVPYDSDKGRGIAGALTAIMTGTAYAQSAKIAARMGSFAVYNKNKESMLDVIRQHRSAVKDIHKECPGYLIKAAADSWNLAWELGEKYGYRNAQATVLAPTGTIGLLMDCDTTGVEPELSLIKIKKLAGGGQVVIKNQSIALSLHHLGYEQKKIEDIVAYQHDHNHIEGAPHLSQEHYAVFDCAFKTKEGKRFILPEGHVTMMAAVQPFISGAISKTVNIPSDAKPEDVAVAYLAAWKMGLKAIAPYRDGSKVSQPLNAGKEEQLEKKVGWGERKQLEKSHEFWGVKVKIGGHTLRLHTGEYLDGTPGEIFVEMYKDGSDFKGALHAWAVASSKALQHGLSLEEFVDTNKSVESEPKGFTDHEYIKSCTSVYDFVARWIELEYLGRKDFVEKSYELKVDPAKLRVNVTKARTKQQPVVELSEKKTSLDIVAGGPPCIECGFSTVRNGTCFKCNNCGATMGCS